MKLKIVSDGINNTRVFDADTGEDLTLKLPIRRITWIAEAGKVCKATLEIEAVSVEIDGMEFHTGIFHDANLS